MGHQAERRDESKTDGNISGTGLYDPVKLHGRNAVVLAVGMDAISSRRAVSLALHVQARSMDDPSYMGHM